MRTLEQVLSTLDQLNTHVADDLEDQDLDFKAWNPRSLAEMVDLAVKMAVCLANGGGGTVVFGVRDRVIGRAAAVEGVPPEIDPHHLKRAIYDRTDPHITPVIEEMRVPEGTGRLLAMQVHGGLPPYTDTQGAGHIRQGKDCLPLTGTMRRRVLVETGASDVTAFPLELEPETAISPAAMERLREAACAEGAPGDLTGQADRDLLASLGVLRSGRLTVAGLLLAGRAEVVRARVPGYRWTWLRMTSDVEYDDRLDGTDAIPEALWKLDQRIEANNPLETVRQGLFHFEHRTWPRIALREALLNAFCHLDLSLGAPVTIRQYTRAADEPFSGPRLEIMNPGGFVGGITPANILHHPPVPRNPALVEALLKLRLVNRSSLGIQRMFAAFLEQGKRPPAVHEAGDAVRVTFLASPFSPAFRSFIEEEHQAGRPLGVDALLVVHALLQAEELDSAEVAALCQRSPAETRALLAELSASRGYLEGGSGRGTWWRLGVRLRERLGGRAGTRVHLNREVAKERILAALAEGAEDGARPLGNQDLRHLLRLTRAQVLSLVQELQCEERLVIEGRGRGARYLPKGR